MGEKWLRCDFNPNQPTWIHLGKAIWSAKWQNQYFRLYWPRNLSTPMRSILEPILKRKLQRHSPHGIRRISAVLLLLADKKLGSKQLLPADLDNQDLVARIWSSAPPHLRSSVRVILSEIRDASGHTTMDAAARLLSQSKAGRNINTYKALLSWDRQQGALTSSELEVIRRELSRSDEPVSEVDHLRRIVAGICFATLKRSSQIITMDARALRKEDSGSGTSWFLLMPLVKAQTGDLPRWEPIPAHLALDIEAYRQRPMIALSAATRKFLLVYRTQAGHLAPLSTAVLKQLVVDWSQKLVSPRTQARMHVTPRRARHTGATHLALQGSSAEEIQLILDHDSPVAARHYIDCVGMDYLPQFEKSERYLGKRFNDLKEAWFKGKVVDQRAELDNPVILPGETVPAIVGECASKSGCPSNPLLGCYSCMNFLAFRDADHRRVLKYVEAMYGHWRENEIGAFRSKAMKDFDRIAASIRAVIHLIDDQEPDYVGK